MKKLDNENQKVVKTIKLNFLKVLLLKKLTQIHKTNLTAIIDNLLTEYIEKEKMKDETFRQFCIIIETKINDIEI